MKNCVYDLGLKWYILITNYIGCYLDPPEGGIQKIAERQNIYILEVRGYLDPPEGGIQKIEIFFLKKWKT